jgi:hypothetical protein
MTENKFNPEKIPEKLLVALSEHLKISQQTSSEWQKKLTDLTMLFFNSEATVYCEDCGLVFYYGKAKPVACEKRFVDWKMLSFRHVWDTRHKVKVYLPFFMAQSALLASKNPAVYGFTKQAMRTLKFDENNQIAYYLAVEALRQQLEDSGDMCINRTSDQNWDAGSSCFCSICGKEYYDPKTACLCHSESKPWLPIKEVESIRVRRY